MNRTILGNELENLNRSETVKPFFKSNRPKKLCVLGIAVKKFIENIIHLKHHFEKYNVEQLIVEIPITFKIMVYAAGNKFFKR